MKFFVVFVALLACVAAYEVELLTEDHWNQFLEDDTIEPETRGLILNSQAKKVVKNFVTQMPCGYPEVGIPPLAPYTNPDLELQVKKSLVDSISQMIRFRLDGLDNMEIKQLKVSYTFSKKVKFHFNFKELKAQADTLNTNTFIDMMNKLGLSVRYEGSGPMEFALEDLTIQGQFKYKMPFIFGSVKIYNFDAVVTLGGVRSNISFILGNAKLNKSINDIIEYMVPALINGNQPEISAMVERNFVPRINTLLVEKRVWTVLSIVANSNKKCYPTPAPWLAEN